MRRLPLLLLLLPAFAHAQDVKKLCEEQWPKQEHPKTATTRDCVDYWVGQYVPNGEEFGEADSMGFDVLWTLTDEDYDRMQRAIVNFDRDGVPELDEYFGKIRTAKFDVYDRYADLDMTTVLDKALAGKKLTQQDLEYWSPLTLVKLRNAPYARHGRPFKNPDLEAFFHGGKPLKLPEDPNFKDSMLDKIDDANVALVVKAQKGELNLPTMSREKWEWDHAPEQGADATQPPAVAPALPDKGFCEERWPHLKKPKPDETKRCGAYYAKVSIGDDIVWKLTAADWREAASQAQTACPSECAKAIEFYKTAAGSHFDLTDPVSKTSIDPTMKKLLAGQKITADEIKAFSAVTLWRFRNAPYARHGRPFKSPDLGKFFYEGTPLKLTPNPKFTDAMLDKVDEQNVGVVMAEIKKRGGK